MGRARSFTDWAWWLLGGAAQVVGVVDLVLSLGLAASVAAGASESDTWPLVFILLMGVTMGLTMPLQMRLIEEVGSKRAKKLFFSKCPPRLGVSLKVVVGLGAGGFVLLWVLGAMGEIPQPGGVSSPVTVLMMACFGLSLSAFAFAAGYSVPRYFEALQRSVCPSGHPMPLDARFCPECGEPRAAAGVPEDSRSTSRDDARPVSPK